MNKATRQYAKQHNTRLILRTIYESGPLSRADVARATRLTRPTVSTLVETLIANGMVTESGIGQSTGGKRPVLLTVPDDAMHLACVDMSNRDFRAAIIDMRGVPVTEMTLPASGINGEAAVARLFVLIEQLLTQTDRPILGISIGSPGLVDPGAGVVHRAVHLDWIDVPLAERLAARFEKPIYIGNDSHVAALAELTFGTSRPTSDNLILLKMGRGIGAGIVWNGVMLTGDGFGAGEVGQLVVAERNGALLTLEQVASQAAILERAQMLSSAELGWEALFESPIQAALSAEVGRDLGVAVANLIATLNIQQIVIAGPIAQFGPPLLSAIRQTARQYAFATMVDASDIRFSTLGNNGVLLGCAAVLLKQELGIL